MAPDDAEALEELSRVSTLLRLLSSKVVLRIIGALSVGELSPRQIAEVTGTDESVVSRKLRKLKEYGIVEYSWVRSGDRNLKVYRLSRRALTLVATYPSPKILLKDLSRDTGAHREETSKALILSYDAPPPRLMVFVGRDKDLKALRDSSPGAVVVTGISGVGKTSLVTEYVHRYGLTGKVIWYEFTGLEDYYSFMRHVASALERRGYVALIDALRRGERSSDLLARLLAEGMDRTGVILVLDDYHKCGDSKVRLLLPVIATKVRASQLIVISRVAPQELMTLTRPLRNIELKGLKFSEVRSLLRNYNIVMDERIAVEVHVATQGIPALVEAFITLVRERGLEEALNALRSGAIASAFWLRIYSSLTPAERGALRVLAHFDEALPAELIAEMVGMKGAVRALYSLVDKGMAEEVGPGFRLKDWVRGVMRLRHVNPAYYVKVGDTYLKSEDVELFIKALRYYVKAGDERKCLVALKQRLLKVRYRLLEILGSYREVLLEIDKFARNPALLGYLNLELGIVLINLGELREGLKRMERAARIAELLEDSFLLVYANSVAGNVLAELGSVEDGLRKCLHALDKASSIRDREFRVNALHSVYANLAKIYAYLGNVDEAYKYVLKEAEVASKLGDPALYLWSLSHVAIVKGVMGKLHESAAMLKQIYRDLKTLKMRGIAADIGFALLENLIEIDDVDEILKLGPEVLSEMYELGRTFVYCSIAPTVTYALQAAGKDGKAREIAELATQRCSEYREVLCTLEAVATYFSQGPERARETFAECVRRIFSDGMLDEHIKNLINRFPVLKRVTVRQ